MGTTSLIVEVLVIGIMALVGIALLTTAIARPITADDLKQVHDVAKDLAVAVAPAALAFGYAIGWIVNFLSERLFKKLFQERVRGRVFPKNDDYELAKITVFQCGSADLVHDVSFDRHIIRLGRAGVVNFAMIAVGLLVYGFRGWTCSYLLALASLALALVSYYQWKSRSTAHYKRIRRIWEFLPRVVTLPK